MAKLRKKALKSISHCSHWGK